MCWSDVTIRWRISSEKVHQRLALTQSWRQCAGWRHHVASATSILTCHIQNVMTSLGYRRRHQDAVLMTLNTWRWTINSISSRLARSTSVTLASYLLTSPVTLTPTSTSTSLALSVDQVVSAQTTTAQLLRRFIPVFPHVLLYAWKCWILCIQRHLLQTASIRSSSYRSAN